MQRPGQEALGQMSCERFLAQILTRQNKCPFYDRNEGFNETLLSADVL